MWKPRHAAKRAVMSVVGAEHCRFDVVDGNGPCPWTSSPLFPLSCRAPHVAMSWRRGIAGRTIDGVDDALQNRWQTIDADERAAAENLAVGVEKRGGRPPAERVTAADIRPPIGVDADRHEPLGNERRRRRNRHSSFDPSRHSRATSVVTIDSRTGFRSALARANAAALHGSQSMPLIGVNYNERMLALRYAAVLALAVWVGGLIALAAVVAPAMFDVLGSTGAGGRLQAATLFAETLRRFDRTAYVCSGVILVQPCGARRAWAPAKTIRRSRIHCWSDAGGHRVDRIRRGAGYRPDAEGDRRTALQPSRK